MSVQMRQPGRALGISTFSSLCGGLFSCVVLVFGATYLAKVALNFKSPEYFALAFFGISIITSVSGKSVIKGLMGGILGLLFATVGVDNFTGTYRFTFGSSFLKGGLAMIPILIGVFAFAQVLKTIEEKYNEQPLHERVKIERVFPRKDDLKTIAPTVVRSSILGTFIGAVPGTGGDIASWVGYNMAKRFSKHPEKFGHGSPEGIAGSEAANNAIAGGAFVPLLALGIPGDAGTAVMMGALTMQGIVFGPSLFTEEPGKAYIVFIALFVANILMGICGFSMIRVFGKVIDVQDFDLDAVNSINQTPNHFEMSASQYANPANKGAFVNKLDFVVLAALEIDTKFNVNVLTGSDGVLRGAPGGHPDTAAGSKVCIIVTPLVRGRMATVCEDVVTVTTPGDCVDVLVTDYGIAVNPLRPDLIKCLDDAGIPHVSIESLKEKAYSIVGRPDPVQFKDKVVAVLEARDGTILDVVREIKPYTFED